LEPLFTTAGETDGEGLGALPLVSAPPDHVSGLDVLLFATLLLSFCGGVASGRANPSTELTGILAFVLSFWLLDELKLLSMVNSITETTNKHNRNDGVF